MASPSYIALCPGCSARLPISEQQIDAANGKVRCANCYTVFYAPDQLLKGFYSSAQKNLNSGESDDILFLPDENTKSTEKESSASHEENATTQPSTNIQPPAVTPRTSPDVSQPATNAMNDFDKFFDDDNFDALTSSADKRFAKKPPPKLSKFRLAKLHKKKHKKPHGFLWWFGSLLLLISITFTIFFAKYTQWAKDPVLRGIYSYFCSMASCKLPVDMEPVLMDIQVVTNKKFSENVYSLQSVLTNKAFYPQPLPVVRLEFIDLQNTVHSTKTFFPKDYAEQKNSLEAYEEYDFPLRVEVNSKVSYRLVPRMVLVSYSATSPNQKTFD